MNEWLFIFDNLDFLKNIITNLNFFLNNLLYHTDKTY